MDLILQVKIKIKSTKPNQTVVSIVLIFQVRILKKEGTKSNQTVVSIVLILQVRIF